MIGHYERQPQCPDTLRKQWRLLVEIPFLSLLDPASELSNGLLVEGSHNADLRVQKEASTKNRITFLFTGRLLLWLPDRVCGIRSTVSVLQSRVDTAVVNITDSESYGPLQTRLINDYLLNSEFCLITKEDSYSNAFFYDAVMAGCLPVVISDWFVFAYPAVIPYHLFVIRITEEDFLKDPHTVLDHIKQKYSEKDRQQMRVFMKHWSQYLSYNPHRSTLLHYDTLYQVRHTFLIYLMHPMPLP